jgi:photosystem II stability/assembly factor-like uncharacterized protein
MKPTKRFQLFAFFVIVSFLITGWDANSGKANEVADRPPVMNNQGMNSSTSALPLIALGESMTTKAPALTMQAESPTVGDINPGVIRNLRPTESYLHAVSLLPSTYDIDCVSEGQHSKGWIVGNSGVILGYCNGLWDHFVIPQSDATDLYAVQAISPTLGVAVGDQGIILMYIWSYTAQAYIWKASSVAGAPRLYGVSAVPDGTGGYTAWAVGISNASGRGALIKGTITPATDINGHPTHNFTWQNVTDNYPGMPSVQSYYSVQMLAPENAWAVGGIEGEKGVIVHWDGNQWSLFQEIPNLNNIYSIRMLSSSDGWAVGSGGTIYHYSGSTWSQVGSPVTGILSDIDFAPNGDGWIVGDNGVYLVNKNNTWTPFTDLRTDPYDMRAIDFTSGHGWSAGAHYEKGIGGQILEYTDDLWLSVTVPTDNQLNSIDIVTENDAWAAGNADEFGGTLIHWDGRHWQRWYQRNLSIPEANLYSVDMTSSDDGWAVGDVEGGKAVFLHWNGYRWARPRDQSPLSTRANEVNMFTEDFGWAMANMGSAVAEYDGATNTWTAPATCGGIFFDLRDSSIVSDPTPIQFPWKGWAVGSKLNLSDPFDRVGDWFMHYVPGCGDRYAWDNVQPAPSGDVLTWLYGIDMITDTVMGYASGSYNLRASIYNFLPITETWQTFYIQPDCGDACLNPSSFFSTDIVDGSNVTWFAGYLSDRLCHGGRREAYINFIDSGGRDWIPFDCPSAPDVPGFFPVNGWNIFHRPIRSMKMLSDTMGWAVGGVDWDKVSVIYLYPHPNFTLTSIPATRAVRPGNSTTYSVGVNSLGGFDSMVALSIGALPPGVTYTIDPTNIDTDVSATITLNTSASTPLDIYDIPVYGYSEYHSGDYIFYVTRRVDLRLTVTDHPITNVSPDKGPSGTIVTITGDNFGADPGAGSRSTPTNHVILADKQMPDANVLTWSPTQITVQVPDSVSLFPKGPEVGLVYIVAGGTESNKDFNYQLENFIQTLETQFMGTYYNVTLTGTSFGQDPGLMQRGTEYEHVSLGGLWIPYNNVTTWSNNTITFTIPISSQDGLVTVTSNGYDSNPVYLGIGGNKLYLPLLKK